MANGILNQLDRGVQLEDFQDAYPVDFCRADGEGQQRRDLLGRPAFGDELQDFADGTVPLPL
jgi:hypothetical protein